MRSLLLIAAFLWQAATLAAQGNSNLWKKMNPDRIALPETLERPFIPNAYHAFRLDYQGMLAELAKSPMEFTRAAEERPAVVLLPQADGSLEPFAFVESPVMGAEVQARYPQIRTYTGHSLLDPNKKAKGAVSPEWGLKVLIRDAQTDITYVEPLALGQNEYYMVYDRRDFPQELRLNLPVINEKPKESVAPNEAPRATLDEPRPTDRGDELAAPVKLKIYRFACATTGEFSQDHGGTKAAVLATMADYTNKLNAIYESDLGIRLVMLNEIESILFLDPDTDPYTGNTVPEWMTQNPVAMLTHLGNFDRYDLGHVFARYKSGPAIGVAGGAACTDFKGRGCSAGNKPYGDYFFSVVSQEIGHQWAGGHTWAYCGGPGTHPDEAVEPGSGSTIMAYAGTCGPDDVQGYSDLYYHQKSIQIIQKFVESPIGSQCGSFLETTNNPPVAEHAYKNGFSIPIRTPFELKGAGSDPDGDPVTYCWEEMDAGPLVPLNQPQGNTAIFRSFKPSASPNRTFPRLPVILGGVSDKTELLPTYTRDLNFALTVRDGKNGTAYKNVAFRATEAAGPFVVTYPTLTTTTWAPGEKQTITWDVANTDKAPVNCQKVNILFSVNGQSFNIVLAEGVPNNGKCCIIVPGNTTTAGRIKIAAADNIFFTISKSFRILPPTTPAFGGLCVTTPVANACMPAYSVPVAIGKRGDFNTPVELSAKGLPAGVTATFTPNPALPGTDAVMKLDFPQDFAETTFKMDIVGVVGSATDTMSLTLTGVSNNFSAFAPLSPVNGATGLGQAPTLKWTAMADANSYETQVATNPSFAASTIVSSGTGITKDSFPIPVTLEKASVYYWRVRPVNECGPGPWSEPFVFSTLSVTCVSFAANDLPKNLSANGTPTIESKISVIGGTVSDVNVKSVKGNHAALRHLDVKLVSPQGTEVQLFRARCGFTTGAVSLGFDDQAPEIPFPCPPNTGGLVRPAQPLAALNGQNAQGDWLLRVKDTEVGSGGSITAFELELCAAAALNAPVITVNKTLQVKGGTNAVINADLLKAEDSDNGPDQLTFTLMTAPAAGRLEREGFGELKAGDRFTQTDLNAGRIRYYEYGFNTGTDRFRFAVTDPAGGFAAGVFNIQPFPVGTDAQWADLTFDLAPNPASQTVRIRCSAAATSDVQVSLFDMSGRLARRATMPRGTDVLSLSLDRLPAGVYAVTLQSEQGSGIKRLIIH